MLKTFINSVFKDHRKHNQIPLQEIENQLRFDFLINSKNNSYLFQLPRELLIEIFSWLTPEDLIKLLNFKIFPKFSFIFLIDWNKYVKNLE